MAIKNNGVITHTERLVCGIAIDIYSIMIKDLYDSGAIPGAWKKFWSEFPKDSLPNNSAAYGVSIPIHTEPGKLHYIAGVEVKAGFVAPSGFELTSIPGGNYLMLDHIGSIMELAASYGEAYGVAFPSAGSEMREGPHLEIYDSTLDPMTDSYVMGIGIPVK